MDTVIGFFEWLVDFLRENGWLIVVVILVILSIVFISAVLIPDDIADEEISNLKDNCEYVAMGQYSNSLVDFRLQRCVVPDGVCYVSSGGGVDCKWENADD